MALKSPGLTRAIPHLFTALKPCVDAVARLGFTKFTDKDPGILIDPGATQKFPIHHPKAAGVFNKLSNNYLTGQETEWGNLTCAHYLDGFDVAGEDLDSGAGVANIKQDFCTAASIDIAMAVQGCCSTALDALTDSTNVKLPGTPTMEDYINLGVTDNTKPWINKPAAVLAVNSTEMAHIKSIFAGGLRGGSSDEEIARYMGFRDLVLVPGMAARAVILPLGSLICVSAVPRIVVNYREIGIQHDDATGLSIGIIVAEDYTGNRLVVDADLWFGVAVIEASAAATKGGAVKVATAA